jgi:predicted PurR-regulated permease PerM
MDSARFDSSRYLWYLGAFAAIGALMYLLAPVLSPFLFAALLAYICLPLVDRLEKYRLPRTLVVMLVLVLLVLSLVALGLILFPVLQQQFAAYLQHVPEFVDWIRSRLLPWVASTFGLDISLDLEQAKASFADALNTQRGKAGEWLSALFSGGLAVAGFIAALVLVPVLLFYFLRDWHGLVSRIGELIPRRHHVGATAIGREVDAVLGEFLRGQLSVIAIMSAYFVIALWLAGLEFALPIGVLAGVLVFVPYLGAIVGLLLATLSGLVQFDNFWQIVPVWIALGLGQLLESMLVTPWLMGDRIGLHPVAVIFALLAFGQLFGFFGLLFALPASAALLVGLRHLKAGYQASELYRS